ncbi:MAG: hypothetical protein ACRDGA_02020, partial [Bacteroidota bacterium]
MNRIWVIVIFLSFVFAACTHTVNVALRPDFQGKLSKQNQLSSFKPAVKFTKGTFADKRGETGMLTSFKEGVHTYYFYEERPVSDAIYE